MNKKILKLMMVPAICTALTACDETATSIDENTTTNGEEVTTEEVTSEITSEVTSETISTISGVNVESDEDLAVVNMLDAYKEGDLLEDAFAGSFSMESNSDISIDASVEDKVYEDGDVTFSADLQNSSMINSYISDEQSSIYAQTTLIGDISFTEYSEELVEDEYVLVEVGLDTDLDLTGRAEMSDATYVTLEGKLPSTNVQPVDSMTEETQEEIDARSNFDYKGYSELNYDDYGLMLTTLLNGDGETQEGVIDGFETMVDLEDDEVYVELYNFLTGKTDNGIIDSSVKLNTDDSITFDISMDLNQVNILGAVSGDLIISALSEGLNLDEEDMLDELSLNIGGSDKKFEVSLTFDENYLPQSFDVDINLDETEIEMSKDSVENPGTYDTNLLMTLSDFEIESSAEFTFGTSVEKQGFTNEEKSEIEDNGENITEFINDAYTELTDILVDLIG